MDQYLELAKAKLADFEVWQKTFIGEETIKPMLKHTEIPVFFTFAYIAVVFYGQAFMANRKPLWLKPFVALWNLGLATFSILGALICVPYLIDIAGKKGYRWTVCTDPTTEDYFYHGPVGAWVYLFVLSKIPELVDTLFLVFQKKDVILLHWFHHFTVMLYCWSSWLMKSPTGIWFATMNFSVHAIMYSYYFFMCFSIGRKIVRPFAVIITTLQIVQMVGGIGISITAYDYMMRDEKCNALDPATCKMGLAMYISYFILFSQLFYKLYIAPKPKKQKTA